MWYRHRTSLALSISFAVLLSLFWFLPSFAFVLFISILLNLLLHDLVKLLARRGIPRPVAALLAIGIFVGVSMSFLAIISGTIAPAIHRFSIDLPALTQGIRDMEWVHESPYFSQQLDELWTELTALGFSALTASLSMIISIFTKVFDIVIILFSTFYLLVDGEKIQHGLASLFPAEDYKRVLTLLHAILHSLKLYINSQLIICLLMGLMVFCYYSFRGLPYASVLALLSGVSEFVPVIGPTLASAFGAALMATVSPLIAAQTALFYLLLTQLNHNIVYPHLIGKSLNLHPLAIILGIMLGGGLLAAPGMFLAVPVMVILRLLVLDIHSDLHQDMCLSKGKDEKQNY